MAAWWEQPRSGAPSLSSALNVAQPPAATSEENPVLRSALASYSDARRRAEESLARSPLLSPPPQAAATPPADKPVFDVGNTLSAAGTFLKQVPTSLGGALAQLYVGGDRPDTYHPWARSLIDAMNRQSADNQALIDQRKAANQSDSTSESLLEASGSSGFTGASALAGLGGFAAGSAAAGPLAGGAAAMGASGVAGFRMAEAGFLDEIFKKAETAMQAKAGRGMTEAEKSDLYQKVLPIAQNTGLWEAGPEAVGNALLALGGGTALGLLGKEAVKSLASSAAKRAGVRLASGLAGVGSEVTTEGATQFHQGNDQARADAVLAGQSPEDAKPVYEGAQGLWQATKDVAPQTLALVGMMGLGAKAVHVAARPIQQRMEGKAAGQTAIEQADLARAALHDMDESQVDTVIQQTQKALADYPKMPKATREQLTAGLESLVADQQARTNGDAFRAAMADPEAMQTRRGQSAVLGMADPARVQQLSDGEVEAASRLADELSRSPDVGDDRKTAFTQAAQQYQTTLQTRRTMAGLDEAIKTDASVIEPVIQSIQHAAFGNEKAGITPEYARAALDDGELSRHLTAIESLLDRHGDKIGEHTESLEKARDVLLAEREHRATQPDWQQQNAAVRAANDPAEVRFRSTFAQKPDKAIAKLTSAQLPLIDSLMRSLQARIGNIEKTGYSAPEELTKPLALLQARKAELESAAQPSPTPAEPPVTQPVTQPAQQQPTAPITSLADALQVTPTGNDPLAELIAQQAPPTAQPSSLPQPRPAPAIPGRESRPAPVVRPRPVVPGREAKTPGDGAAELSRLLGPQPQQQQVPAAPQQGAQSLADLLQRSSTQGAVASSPSVAQGPIAPPAAPIARPKLTQEEIKARQTIRPSAAELLSSQPTGAPHEKGQAKTETVLKESPPLPNSEQAGGAKSEDFVKATDGSLDFGRISPEAAKALGRQEGPIRLQVGHHDDSTGRGFGKTHIGREGRIKELEKNGYASTEALIEDVAKNHNAIYEGKNGTYILAKENGKAKIAFVTVKQGNDGVFYSVGSGLIARADYLKNRSRLWDGAQSRRSRSTDLTPSAVSGQQSELENTIPASSEPGKAQPSVAVRDRLKAPIEPDFSPATPADRQDQARREALADPEFRAAMEGYRHTTGWAERGGHLILKNADEAVSRDNIAGRTQWLPNSPWWAASTGARKGFNETQIKNLLERFQRGEAPKNAKESRFLDFLLEDIADEKARNAESAALEAELTPKEQERLDRAEQEARAWLGEDRYEALLESLAKQYPDASPAAFNRALLDTLETALAQRNDTSQRHADVQPGTANRTGRDGAGSTEKTTESAGAAADEESAAEEKGQPLLSGYSAADLKARDEAVAKAKADQAAKDKAFDQKAAADEAAKDFRLTGSDRPADVTAAKGQDWVAQEKPAKADQKFAQASRTGQTPGLFAKAPIVVTRLTGDEFGSGLGKKELAKAADALLRRLQAGAPLTNQDTGWTFVIGNKDRLKMGDNAHQSLAESKAIAGLVQLVRHAVLGESHADIQHQNPDVSAIHRLYAPLQIGETLYRVKLTVKDYTAAYGRRNVHALESVEIENALSLGTVPAKQELLLQPDQPTTTERTLSIDQLFQGSLRDSDGQPFRPDAGQSFARASSVTPATILENLKALADDATVQALLDNGRLRLVARQADLPSRITVAAGERVAGAVDPKTGQVYLVAENIRPEDITGFLTHEVGVHQAQLNLNQPKAKALRLAHAVVRLVGARRMLGETSFSDVLNQLERMRAAGHTGVKAAFAQAEAAMKALDQTPALLREEALAYLVQHRPNLPLVKRIVAAVRAFLYRAGFRVSLTENDVRALAVSALKGAARQGFDRFTRTPQQEVIDALRIIKEGDDLLFQSPTAQSKALSEILKEIYPDVSIERPMSKEEIGGIEDETGVPIVEGWAVKAPVKQSNGKMGHDYVYFMRGGDKGDRVWIDVSNLKEGSSGSRIYMVAADWAYNNGWVFQGDPAGLSDKAVYRRTETMLASAIKHGTTRHLEPHPKQKLHWTNDDDQNFKALVQKSADNLLAQVPQLKGVHYDFQRRQFEDGDGRPFTDHLFTELAQSRGARAAQAGSATLKRASFIQSLSSKERGSRTGGRERLLGAVVRELRQPVSTGGLKGIFYARAYTADQEAAMAKIGKLPPTPKSWKERFAGLTDRIGLKLRQAVADQYASLLALDQQAYGGDVVENQTAASAWVKARLSRSVDGPMNLLLHEAALKMDADGALDVILGSKGLKQILEPLGVEADDFLKWVAGWRADRLKKEDRERLFTDADIAALKALNQGTMPDGRSRAAVYGKALREFSALQKSVMDIAEQAGLIDAKERKVWEHDFYVPFYRLAEDTQDARSLNAGDGLVRQEAFKRLKGGKDRLNDLLENTVMNWHHLLSASLKNSAARQALINAQRVVYDGGKVAERIDPNKESTKGAVFYRQDGKEQWFRVNDPLILEAITSLDFAGVKGPLMDAMRKTRMLLTRTTTINPAFKVANLLRDTVQTLAVSKADVLAFDKVPRFRNVIPGLGNIVQGWKNYAADSAIRRSLLAGGGAFRFGTSLEGNAEALKKLLTKGVRPETILDTPKKLFDLLGSAYRHYEDLGDKLENVNRASLYQQLRQQGKSHLYASFQARDLLDFSAGGASGAVRILTAVVPFLNARIQGLDKLGRAATQPAQRGRFAVTLLATTLASVLLYLWFKDDPDFKEREEWDRDTYWWAKIGGVVVRIPKPFEVGALATLLGDRVVEQMVDKEADGKLYLDRLKFTLTQTFAISGPQLLMPALNVWANKDPFTGRPIETTAQQRLSPGLRRNARTSDTAQAASALSGGTLSPVQADYLIGAYFGWLGRQAVLLADYATRPLTDRRVPERMPVVGDLIQRFMPTEKTGSKYLTAFYERSAAAERHYADIRELLRRDEKEAARLLLQRHADEIGKLKVYRAAGQQLHDMNVQLRALADLPASKFTEGHKAMQERLQKEKLRLARAVF